MGVEKRPVHFGGAGGGRIYTDWSINLLTARGVHSVEQVDVRFFKILDDDLAEELREALRTVAAHRDQRSTEIAVRFTGEGERPVRIGYTHEAPVWKTSYRLVLPEASEGDIALHGWAIVENDTGADWDDVELTLASGRPVSFVMDLQTPLILDRPHADVPVIAGLGGRWCMRWGGRSARAWRRRGAQVGDMDNALRDSRISRWRSAARVIARPGSTSGRA